MIKVTARCKVKEDGIETFKAITSKLIDETRKEEGCIRYELFQDLKNENMFMFVEDWKSRESHIAHDETKHIKELVPEMNKVLAEPLEVLIMDLVK